jgi:hypothetical protein
MLKQGALAKSLLFDSAIMKLKRQMMVVSVIYLAVALALYFFAGMILSSCNCNEMWFVNQSLYLPRVRFDHAVFSQMIGHEAADNILAFEAITNFAAVPLSIVLACASFASILKLGCKNTFRHRANSIFSFFDGFKAFLGGIFICSYPLTSYNFYGSTGYHFSVGPISYIMYAVSLYAFLLLPQSLLLIGFRELCLTRTS